MPEPNTPPAASSPPPSTADVTGYDPEMDATWGTPDPAPEKPASPAAVEAPKETPAPAAPKTEKPAHSPAVVRLAKDFGMTDARIAALRPDVLDEIVYEWVAQQDALRREFARDAHARPPAPAVPPPPPPEDDLGITDDEYDPKIVGLFRTQKQEIEALKKSLADQREGERQRVVASLWDACDLAFEALGAEAAAVFGDGTRGEIGAGAEMRRRVAVIQEAGLTDADTPASIRRKIAAAAEVLYGTTFGKKAAPAPPAAAGYEGVADRPVRPDRQVPPKDPQTGRFQKADDAPPVTEADEEKWAKAGGARPTSRAAADLPPGLARAERNLANGMKKLGYEIE